MSALSSYFRFDGLTYPGFLWLGIPVLLLLLAELWGKVPGALHISTGDLIAALPKDRLFAFRAVPGVLRAVGLLLLLLALAGPTHGFYIRKDRAGIIDIMLSLDVSGSMQQTDFVIGGRPRDRLYVAREAIRKFIDSRRLQQDGRFGTDRLGLILFSGLAWTQCPLTLDYDVLERELDNAQIAAERKQGTAIGSALGLAVQRLLRSEAKSKVVLLLSDGVNNRGELDPVTAARFAKEYGIRVYTIGAGSPEEKVMTRGLLPMRTEAIDEALLKQIAAITGGRYYLASDTEALMRAYEEISTLETTEIDVGDYYEAREGFLPFLLAGTMALLTSVFVRRMWFDVIP